MSSLFCNSLSGNTCSILNTSCFRLRQKKQCEFYNHNNFLINSSNDPQKTTILKQKIYPEFIARWTDFANLPSTGKKSMTGIPVEKGVRSSIKNELTNLDVSVHPSGKKFEIWDDVRIIADILAQKQGYPTSIISVKSWIGTTQIRETFAYAYFSKTWLGQKNIRLFMITLHPLKNRLMKLIRACMPFIDGVYSLSGNPYYDDLLTELHNIYR